MRIHFPATKATILFVAMTVVFGVLTLVPTHVAALTSAQKKNCENSWNGKTLDPSGAKFKNFQDSNCSDSYCDFVVNEAKNTATISCPAKDAGTSGGGSNDCADTSTKACSIADPALSSGGCTGKDCSFIDAYINPIIKLLSALVGVTAVIFIIFGAIQVSSSAGDPQKSASGKAHIRNALIGLVTYALLFGLINFLVPGGIV
jgi:hypothetical protein